MLEIIKKNRKLVIFEGILFIILGMFAIALPNIFTLGIELLIGWLFLIGGCVQAFRSFKTKESPGFWPSLLVSLLSIAIGILLLVYPLGGILTLTLLLSLFFLFEGCAKIIMAFQMRQLPQWGWILVSGIIALIIAGIIWSQWPSSAYWVIGLLVGVNMLFFGCSLLVLGIGAGKDSDEGNTQGHG